MFSDNAVLVLDKLATCFGGASHYQLQANNSTHLCRPSRHQFCDLQGPRCARFQYRANSNNLFAASREHCGAGADSLHRRESWATPQGHRPANPAGGIEMRLTPVLCLCPLGYDIIESESGGVGFLPSSPPSPRREEDSSVAAQAGRPVLKSCMAGPGSGAPGDSEPESQSDRRSRSLTHCHRDCPGQRASRDVGSLPCHRHGAHGRGRRASSLCDSKTITMERGIKLIIYLKAAALRRRRGRFKL